MELVLFHFSSSVIHGVACEYTAEGQIGKQVNADCMFIYKRDGYLDYMARKTRERKLPELHTIHEESSSAKLKGTGELYH